MERKFRNKTKIVRVKHDKDNPYTCITNTLIQDDRLNATELGIMLELLSNADSYILNSTYFIQQTGITRYKFYKCWNHLIALGYINKIKIQGGYQWIINESAKPLKKDSNSDESTPSEINPDEITPDENELIISTNETSINETTIKEQNKNEKIENITRDTSIDTSTDTGENPDSFFSVFDNPKYSALKNPEKLSREEHKKMLKYLFYDRPKWDQELSCCEDINYFLKRYSHYIENEVAKSENKYSYNGKIASEQEVRSILKEVIKKYYYR